MRSHSRFAVGLFPYLFKHAPVNYSSRSAPSAPCSYGQHENMLLPRGGENVPLDAGRTEKGTQNAALAG